MAFQYGSEEGGTRSLVVKIAVIVVALGAALFFVLRGDSEGEQPDTEESADTYICLNCGHVFKLTPAEVAELGEEGGSGVLNEKKGLRFPVYRCPECGQIKGTQADECPTHHTFFPRRLEDGTLGRCPECGWSFFGPQ